MEAGTPAPRGAGGTGYSGPAFLGAAIATVCFPLLALIVALLLLGAQTDPQKRSELRRWAWISAIWLVVGVVLAVVLASVTF